MKIHIVYMAAGNSSRFGSNKLLHMLNGQPMYMYGIQLLREVAALYDAEDIKSINIVSRYNEILEHVNWNAIYSPDSVKGVSYTIKAGLKYIIDNCGVDLQNPNDECVMFMVADQPYLTKDTIKRLIETALSDDFNEDAIVLKCGDVTGNPCIFRMTMLDELCELSGDKGGKSILKNKKIRYVESSSMRELVDIDVSDGTIN